MRTLHKNIVYNSFIIALCSIVYNAVYYSHHKGSSPDNHDRRRQAAEREPIMKATTHYVVRYEAPFQSLEFGTINGEKIPALVDNKVQPLSADMFRVYNCGAYVDDVAAHVQAIREAHEKALEAEAALTNAVSAYNGLTRGRIAQASTRGGVNRRFII